MDRRQLCDSLFQEIKSTSTNAEIMNRLKTVIGLIEAHINQHIGVDGTSADFIENVTILRYRDLTQAIEDIANRRAYSALTRIWDFLLKGKRYELPLGAYELMITHTFLSGLLQVCDVSESEQTPSFHNERGCCT